MNFIFDRIINRYQLLWDKINGVDFSAIIPVNELGFDESSVFRGSSSRGKKFRDAFLALNIEEGARILDVGCAKGGAIYDLYNFPFARIDGIEISSRLFAIANQNLLKLNLDKTTIHNCDAKEFISYANYEYFYLYNPFDLETMNSVITQIISQNKKFKLVYHNPVGHDILITMGFEVVECFPGLYGNKIAFYRFGFNE